MANTARLVITVSAARGSVTVRYNTHGRYVSLPVSTLANFLPGQPLPPGSTPAAFWGAILDVVEQDITGHS